MVRRRAMRTSRRWRRRPKRIGLDSFWLADHLIYRYPDKDENGCWEVFTFLSAVAAVTTTIAIGPLVACTSFRNPALLAKMADALDEISGGRFILGLGCGWHEPEYDAFGYPFDHRVGRFEEAMAIIAPLLREGRVDFHGKYYEVTRERPQAARPFRDRPETLDRLEGAPDARTDRQVRRCLEHRLAHRPGGRAGAVRAAQRSVCQSRARPLNARTDRRYLRPFPRTRRGGRRQIHYRHG